MGPWETSESLDVITEAVQSNSSKIRKHNGREIHLKKLNAITWNIGMTGLGEQVLQGYKRQVKGSNGRATAQPSRPWGSTRTFQLPCYAGRWRVTGIEARGGHVREGSTFVGRHDPAVPRKESITKTSTHNKQQLNKADQINSYQTLQKQTNGDLKECHCLYG